jgi:hypothetical protein
MSFELLSERLQEIARNLDDKMPDIIATQSMVELQGEWEDRIALYGKNTNGDNIGTYSTKPAYFSESEFIRKDKFKPQGKDGFKGQRITYDKKKGTAKISKKVKPKSMFLQGGYNQFRDIQGRETPNVNLKFSGSMLGAYRVYKIGNEVLFGNADLLEHKKTEGNTKRFGEWSALTEGEKGFLKESIIKEAIIVAKQ